MAKSEYKVRKEKVLKEIEKQKISIVESQKKIKECEVQLQNIENEQIISVVKNSKLSAEDIAEMVSMFSGNQPLTTEKTIDSVKIIEEQKDKKEITKI